jgi:predicted ribosome quality control (RQC) complex YloA/Tae2 family protein
MVRRAAETLLIHRDRVARGASHVALPDPEDPARAVEIDLDPALGLQANAEALFRRARRLDRGAALRGKRLRALEEAIARLSQLRVRAQERGTDPRERGAAWLREALGPFVREPALAAWERAAAGEAAPASRSASAASIRSGSGGRRAAAGSRASRAGSRKGPPEIRPRTYRTREGWTVLIGRSDEENDLLTHRMARPEDYWFHAHGCAGSHVILQREGRKDNPSARTIEEVAAIAAHFSKARTSRKVPVVYTLKKYVRKPRGGAPGLAVLTREKTILVEPKAPPDPEPTEWGP